MSKVNGFLQLRRGLWEHVRDGRMSVTQALAFIYVCSEADTRTGIWKGSAKSLSGELGIPERTARDVLETMERDGYIRRFAVPGRHSCYPILVHKFLITDGEHNGEQLNAMESKSLVDLAYFPCEQTVGDSVQPGVEYGAAQKRKRIEKKTEKKAERKTTPSVGDLRYGPFLEFAKASFVARQGHPPTWDCFGKDGAALTAFLRRAPHVTLDIWQRHILNFFDSTEAFTLKQGGNLSYFVSRFDTFSSGPIQEGTNNGNTRTFADIRSQRTAAAITRVLGAPKHLAGCILRALPAGDN